MAQQVNKREPENEVISLLVGYTAELNNTNKIVFLGLGLTTIYTVYNTALPKFEALGFLGNFGVRAAATIVTLFIYRLFDGDLRKNVVLAIRAVRSQDWKSATAGVKSVGIFFLLLAGLRLFLSGGATLVSSIFIGDDLVSDGNTEVVEDVVKTRQENKAFVLSNYAQQIGDAQRTENSRVQDARDRGQKLIEAAIASGTPSQREMWKHNPGFFTSLNPRSKYYNTNKAYYERIREAKAEAKKLEESERQLVSRLRTDKARELAQVAEDTTETMLVQLETMKLEKAAIKEWIITTSLTSVDILLFIIAILTSNALALVMPYRKDFEFFDHVPSIWPVIWEGLLSFYRIIINGTGYGVYVVDGVAAKQLERMTDDSSGVLKLLRKEVRFSARDTGSWQRDTGSGAADTEGRMRDTEAQELKRRKDETPSSTGDTGGTPTPQSKHGEKQSNDTGDTEEGKKRDTGDRVIEIPKITAEEIVLIKKRARRNWERSFAEHKDAPKDEKARRQLRSKAKEEIETLQLIGYKVQQDNENPMRLEIDAPPAELKKVKV